MTCPHLYHSVSYLFFSKFVLPPKVRASVQQLHTALPREEGWLHTFAVKANPTLPSLEVLGGAGVGFEAASVGELTQGTCASPAVSDCNLLTTQLALGCLSRRVNEDQGVRCCTPAIRPAQPLHYSGVRKVTARVLDSVLNHFVIILSSSHTHARIHARTHSRGMQGLRALGVQDSTFPEWFGFGSNSSDDKWVPWPEAAAAKYGTYVRTRP